MNIVLLDLAYWINLGGRDGADRYNQLARLEAEKKIQCVIAPSIVIELMKQQDSDRRSETARAIHHLSGSMSLPGLHTGFRRELAVEVGEQEDIDGVVPWFTAYMQWLACFVERDLATAIHGVLRQLDVMPLEEALAVLDEPSRKGIIEPLLAQLAAIVAVNEASPAVPASEVRRVERETIVITFQPQIHEMQARSGLSDDAITEAAFRCPTAIAFGWLLGQLRASGRVKENDIFDLLHLTSGVVYADVVAGDGRMAELVGQTHLPFPHARVVRNWDALEEALERVDVPRGRID